MCLRKAEFADRMTFNRFELHNTNFHPLNGHVVGLRMISVSILLTVGTLEIVGQN